MRTVTLQSVYHAILRRHGYDPLGDRVGQDTARAIVEHINQRVHTAWRTWPIPELTNTEERAYRTVWNDSRQFHAEDELFFIPSASYYKVLTGVTPPVGTPPATLDPVAGWITDATYYEPLTVTDTYIAYDQTCKKPIEQVLGVYSQNPRNRTVDPYGPCGQGIYLLYRPSEKGIDIISPGGPTVFIHYMIPPPTFTLKPHIEGKSYNRADRVFYPPFENCYRSLADANTTDPSDPTYWTLEPFPAVLAGYVKAGAYSDCLRETFDKPDLQTRTALATAAAAEAEDYLRREIDKLTAERQLHFYTRPFYYPAGVYVTQPWSGYTVSELTDECEEDWTYPPPPPAKSANWIYRSDIKSLRGPEQPSLSSLPSTGFAIGAKIEIVIGNQGQEFQVRVGAADPADPGHVAFDDYDPVTNNKHAEKVA